MPEMNWTNQTQIELELEAKVVNYSLKDRSYYHYLH